ncbi:unknown protein [Seminavis robusta]|uniref:Uncharacterized protein n=1 Tax=Seminavis robusta TaxID=568900 RepID=A0A9N8EUS9_9STRA|nr:unknown protein [Seminavis robusta]|eukprot:Sro2029_g311780.1 n/a (177) ;mRNA; r:16485-17015
MQTTKDLIKPEPREVPVRLSFLLLLFVGVLVSTTVRQELIQFQRYEAAYTLSRSSNGTVSSVSVTFHEVGKSDSVVVGTAASAAAQPSRSLHDEEAPKQEPAAPPQENAEEVTPQESADKKWTIVVDDSKAETSSESSPGKNIEQLKQEAATPEQPEQLKQDTTLTIEKTSLGGTN